MRLSTSIIFPALLGLAAAAKIGDKFSSPGTLEQGFTIPEDLPAGTYTVTYDDSGTAQHTLVGLLNETIPDTATFPASPTQRHAMGGALLRPRSEGWQEHCSTRGPVMPQVETDLVIGHVQYQMCQGGTEVEIGEHMYSIYRFPDNRGPIAGFFCLLAHRTPTRMCRAKEFEDAQTRITGKCGNRYNPGWSEWWSDDVKEYIYGYDWALPTLNFCGRDHHDV